MTPNYTSPGRQVSRFDGSGDPNRLLLLMARHDNLWVGLGDHIASLPVIYELRRLGYELTVYATPFVQELYERAGCEFIPAENIRPGLTEDSLTTFGSVYWLCEWSLDEKIAADGAGLTNFTDLFASFFGITAPPSFDYPTALGFAVDESIDERAVIYAPTASSPERDLASAGYIHRRLNREYGVVWLGAGQTMFGSLPELISTVGNARGVFCVDTGIVHVAMALNVPTFAVFGPSDPFTILGQYDRYSSGPRMVVLSAPNDKGCTAPCSKRYSRGWNQGGRCDDYSRCMIDAKPDELLTSFSIFLTNKES
ncbi:MAG: hypothetical protein JSS75_07180 [Bacteroidetes bacterium]|nr:hypothetical protein [Bacteroidota bacterium]